MSDWQPIETAPKDGTWILAYWDEPLAEMMGIAWCNDEIWHGEPYSAEPTHWMPLPEPPKDAA